MLFLRRDITREDQVELWLNDVRTGLTTSVAAIYNDELVGYASVASDGLTWTRHVRELRVAVGESMRRLRLGRLLMQQAFAIAREQGALKMIAQMTVDQEAAISVFKKMGFEPEALLRRQVMDRDGTLHDLQIMSLDVEAFRARLDMLMADAETRLPVH
jgi:L-amino acid N-acyltransferase YncA